MTERSIIYRFTGGEISPSFFGATDLEKYGIGVAQARNTIIDYRGGAKNRTGFEFIDFLPGPARLVTYSTGDEVSDLLMIFGDGTLRFMQDGSFLLEPASAETVTGVAANVLTFAAHSFVVDELVYLEDTTLPDGVYTVTAATATTITVALLNGVVPANEGTFSSGTVEKVWTITTPYAAADLPTLRFKQRQNELFVTTTKVIPQVVEFRNSAWEIDPVTYEDFPPAPTGVTLTPSTTGGARIVYLVTAVDADGNESPFAIPKRISNSVNFTATAGSLTVKWASSGSNAAFYRIYRSLVAATADVNTGAELGFIGETTARVFVDANIVPDFTRQPPRYINPFVRRAIFSMNVVDGSWGENAVPIITTTEGPGTGTGFLAYIVLADGDNSGIIILNQGSEYITEPVFNIAPASTGGPTISTMGDYGPLEGPYPAVAESFQQRMVFAGTEVAPMTLWGTRSGSTKNFSVSTKPVLSDAFSFSVAADELVPIRHLVRQSNGLLIMHSRGVDKLSGSQGDAVGPGNAAIRNEVAIGVGPQPPLSINNDVVFVTEVGTGLVSLAYTFYSNSYQPLDLSVLSGHLFPQDNAPVRMAWHDEPDRLVWLQRADGTALTLTYLREQEIYAWAQHNTRGYFEDFVVLNEGNSRRLYTLTRRLLNGEFRYCIERQRPRATRRVENFFGVDCGLSTNNLFLTGTGTLSLETVDEVIFLQASGTPFGSVVAGDVVFAFGGRYLIEEVVSTSRLRVVQELPALDLLPSTEIVLPTTSWTVSRPTTTIGNLWHLEGETVSVLADGDATLDLVVTDGQVELQNAAAVVHVGLPYISVVDTLPLAAYSRIPSDGRRKRPTGIALRLQETRGLETGLIQGPLYEMKDRGFEAYGEVTNLQNGVSMIAVGALWEQDAQLRFRQRYPLPMTILGLVAETEVEDA